MEGHWSLLATYALAVIIEIGLPITLAVLITKKWKVSWLVILTGVLTFIGSQIAHLPILALPTWLTNLGLKVPIPQNWGSLWYALYAGVLAGLCEETARWVGFKILKSKASSYKSAFALGIGHGGIESAFIGVIVLVNVLTFAFMNTAAIQASGASADVVQTYTEQLAQFWATPWHLPLAGAVERITAISAQILMSVMVWKAVTQRSFLWYLLAVVYHTVLDAFAGYLSLATKLTAWQLEACLLVFLVFNLVFLYRFWRKQKAQEMDTEATAAEPPVLPAQ